MRLVPLANNIVLQRVSSPERTAGGIVLPDSARNAPNEGRVLSVGSGKLDSQGNAVTPQVHEGDRVLFSGYAGTKFELDGAEVIILSESDILAVIG